MNERHLDRKAARAERELDEIARYVERSWARSPDGYFADFLSRKSRAETATPLYGAMAAIAANVAWGLVAGLLGSTPPASFEGEALGAFRLFLAATSVVLMATSVLFVWLFYHFNRQEARRVVLEEYVLRRLGHIE